MIQKSNIKGDCVKTVWTILIGSVLMFAGCSDASNDGNKDSAKQETTEGESKSTKMPKSDWDVKPSPSVQKALESAGINEAVKVAEQECATGELASCYWAALQYDTGFHIKKNLKRAIMHYTNVCNSGMSLGCFKLGIFHQKGEGGVARNYERAMELYKRACDDGVSSGCSAAEQLQSTLDMFKDR